MAASSRGSYASQLEQELAQLRARITKLEEALTYYRQEMETSVNPRNVLIEKTEKYYQFESPLRSNNGLVNVTFQFSPNFELTPNTAIVTMNDIYYGDILIASAGDIVKHYSQLQAWGQITKDEYNAIVDLRPPGLYGNDYRPELHRCGQNKEKSENLQLILRLQ